MFLVHTAGVVNVGINLAKVVKVPRTRKSVKLQTERLKGDEVPVWDILFKLRESTTMVTKV